MSRIGKTTILKATLNDIKYMYNGACFLKCIEDNDKLENITSLSIFDGRWYLNFKLLPNKFDNFTSLINFYITNYHY
uniref:NB-ARC domain-containing protein n=1 Tax=Physcomitrium patens TaxID=3218 RepID=A0A2K1K1I1_PHYPA|nr:hypothetical protein PHYPA_012109 [Physcomitrium patens]